MFSDHGARNRHSDNEKFSNDLNEQKTPKMSERPLKTRQDFPPSKLNTRVRFPSPAAMFSSAWAIGGPGQCGRSVLSGGRGARGDGVSGNNEIQRRRSAALPFHEDRKR
jgi:hypothetical protein